jgi:NADH-quinone oxidoreductase subunit J
MAVPSLLFYIFSFILLSAGVAVITSKNPVHAVFFLIVAFFNAAGLFVLLGAEYMAMTLVIVYVGAVAVLFLFVVMMLNVNFEKVHAGFIRRLPLGIFLALVLFGELGALLSQSLVTPAPTAPAAVAIPDAAQITNAQAIGTVLYTRYMLAFEVSGLILLVAMIGAIILTHRQRAGVRKQVISDQLKRTKANSLHVTNVKSGEGA